MFSSETPSTKSSRRGILPPIAGYHCSTNFGIPIHPIGVFMSGREKAKFLGLRQSLLGLGFATMTWAMLKAPRFRVMAIDGCKVYGYPPTGKP